MVDSGFDELIVVWIHGAIPWSPLLSMVRMAGLWIKKSMSYNLQPNL